jgi:putative transposase
MIDRKHALPISQQARLVGVARSSLYYRPQLVSMLMRRIDELHMEFPFAGARMLARLLRREGREVGRRRVRTLMKRIGIEALHSEPKHEPTQKTAQDLAVPAARYKDQAGQSGVVTGQAGRCHG